LNLPVESSSSLLHTCYFWSPWLAGSAVYN